MFVIPKCCGNEHASLTSKNADFGLTRFTFYVVLSFKQKLTKQLTFVHFNHIVDDY